VEVQVDSTKAPLRPPLSFILPQKLVIPILAFWYEITHIYLILASTPLSFRIALDNYQSDF
jgi:hypothetical protein